MIASPDEFIFFNDARIKMENRNARQGPAQKNIENETEPDARLRPNGPSNKMTTRLAMDLAFNFTTRKWENDHKEFDHEDLKFISTEVPGANDCLLKLDDI